MAVAHLPGVHFETHVPPPADVLPRMDIAAFVGFAASGPLHTPVALEDSARFGDIFGRDLALAWDTERGVLQHAYLAATVDAFFKNGGRRCWVVRVADAGEAKSYRFSLPGVSVASTGAGAEAVARSEGRWAGDLVAGTVLRSEALRLVRSPETSPPNLAVLFPPARDEIPPKDSFLRLDIRNAPSDVQEGDLVELRFDERLVAFCFVAEVRPLERGLCLVAREADWFHVSESSPPTEESPMRRRLERIDTAGLTLRQGWEHAGSPRFVGAAYRLGFDILVWRGDELVSRLADLGFHRSHRRYCGHLPTDRDLFRRRQTRDYPAHVRTFREELSHPRFPLAWNSDGSPSYLPLEREDDAFFLEMEDRPRLDLARPPRHIDASSLVINGLSKFGARLDADERREVEIFLDKHLAPVRTASLLGEAEHRYYRLEPPRELKGIHSLLPIDEVTIVAVPDAVHPGWEERVPDREQILEAPVLREMSEADGRREAEWSPVEHATGYQLQRDERAHFPSPEVVYRGGGAIEGESPSRAGARFSLEESCADVHYFRARATRGGGVGPWSNTVTLDLTRDFDPCQGGPLPVLNLVEAATSPEVLELEWNRAPDATEYELEESIEPTFESAELVYRGEESSRRIPSRNRSGFRYFRVRARREDFLGPWSNTLILPPVVEIPWRLRVPDRESEELAGELLCIQRALLRFCRSRGDMLALLSFPRHFTSDEVLDHLGALTSGNNSENEAPAATCSTIVPPLGFGEEGALGFAAAYHPWLALRRERSATTAIDFVPPDGTLSGTWAARALNDGAWLAPANMPLEGVLALEPELDTIDWNRLTPDGVNIVLDRPRGYLVLNADTLSHDEATRPINVRRLLILLRRLALREGNTYVFEPHEADFRSAVRHRFETILSNLYVRGAFAGTTPEAGYRVVADETVNPPQSVERGRFVVELRVAPSRPLAFLTVRLLQSGPEQFAVEGA